MMQSLAGEVNTALSTLHHGYTMCFKLSSCRSQLAIWFQLANAWLTTFLPTTYRGFPHRNSGAGCAGGADGCVSSSRSTLEARERNGGRASPLARLSRHSPAA